ncbi:hypothetical protein ACFFRR_000110 [Megaselia abdita]
MINREEFKMIPLFDEIKPVPTFEDAIKAASFGKFNYFLLIVAGISFMAVVVETSAINIVAFSAEKELSFTMYEKSFLMSAGFVGIIIGNLPLGYLSDIYGRVLVLKIILSIASISSFLSVFSVNTMMLVLFRFLTGFALSGCQSSVFTLVSEYNCEASKSKQLALLAAFLPIGLIYANGMATVILQSFSWRALLFVYLLPSLVALFGLFAVPESPKFQFHIGKLEECMNTLKKMYAINTGDPTLKFPCKLFQKQDSDTTDNNINIKRLFQKPLLLQTILLCSIAFIMSMAGGGLYMWTPTVFNAIDYFQNKTVCEALIDLDEKVTPNSSSFLMMMISMSFLVFFTLTSSVIKKVGKKLVLGQYKTYNIIGHKIIIFVFQYFGFWLAFQVVVSCISLRIFLLWLCCLVCRYSQLT